MKAHIYVDSKGGSARSYGDIFGAMLGTHAQRYAWAMVWSLAFFSIAGYMLTIANNVQNLFYDLHLCTPQAALIACLIVLPGSQIRCLHNIATHAIASFMALLIVIVIAMAFLLSDGASCQNEAPGALDFWGAFNSVGSFIWAYAGISYYPEILAEMKQPQDFARKSLFVAFVLMTGLYISVTCITFARCGEGTPDSLVSVIPRGPWLRVAAFLTVYHVTITYLISSNVLIRGVVTSCGCLETALQPGLKGRLWWFGISLAFTMFAYLFADAIPQFDNLANLNGNIVCTQGCLILPGAFFLLMQRVAPWREGFIKVCLTLISWAMVALGLFLFAAGTLSSVITIWQDAHKNDAYKPFACQALS